MGANWYNAITVYGYSYNGSDIKKASKNLYFPPNCPITGFGLLKMFNDRIGMIDEKELDEEASLVVGFIPSDDLNETLRMGKDLEEFMKTIPNRNEFKSVPRFHTGLSWERAFDCDDE
jgi:hypothetical protein